MFRTAKRQQAKLRLALVGPSGSGKTYSSLLLAKGLGGKVAMIDTERGSGELYADLVDYDVQQLSPPFEPQAYINALNEAEAAGYEILIIDSLSHAWAGQGGVLEIVDKANKVMRNNFAAWREATPQHNALVDAMLQSGLHLIVTMRTKTHYDMLKDEKTGKVRPVKVGLAPVQRDGLEYEFTTVLDLSVEGHIAVASKDRTGLFDGDFFKPHEQTGEGLRQWLDGSGHEQKKPEVEILKLLKGEVGDKHYEGINQILEKLRALGLAEHVSEYEQYLQKKYTASLKELSSDQIGDQLENLNRCEQDSQLLQRLQNYLCSLAA
ncbi:ATP-binding protein [Desulfohalobium retbaense]|uniref:AAA ATPase n=1 Tax=Desulfohalobium retbaense (strain ATCC 49708 / DSM 5692 / JCM 16813 / HR100) TaxID=485915 RepID=C8X3A6_DESRD|nr:ATP-binding protein [Desulfohalobium retbaense]ACV68903.1 AAA ATPase [Desulfohalobium retbaense DSM 5692]